MDLICRCPLTEFVIANGRAWLELYQLKSGEIEARGVDAEVFTVSCGVAGSSTPFGTRLARMTHEQLGWHRLYLRSLGFEVVVHAEQTNPLNEP